MESGKTILNLQSIDRLGLPRGDAMLHAVREVTAGIYDLLGELGRNRYGSIVYLGREVATGELTALKLDVSPNNSSELELTVATELDESIPALGYECHYCGERLDSWGRFCTACGRDVSGVIPDQTSEAERNELLAAVRSAAAGEYEILGEMRRVRGGGIVYFARELQSSQIIALRLQRDQKAQARGETEYSLGKTQVLKPLLEGPERGNTSTPPAAPRVDPIVAPASSRPQGRTGPELAQGDVTDHTPSEPTPPVAAPPVSTRRSFGKRHLAIGGGVLALMLAVVAVAVSTEDDPAPKQPIVVDTMRQQLPPPPPQPLPQPSPPPAADSAELVLLRLPRGAQVTVDGVVRRANVIKLSVGKHLIEATAPGYSRVRQQVELGPGRTERGLRFAQLPDTTKKPTVVTQETVRQPPPPPKPTCASVAAAGDWQAARQLCVTEGQGGNAHAERQMAVIYLRGLGGPRDEAQAVVWLQRSADGGDRDSQYDLARVYQTSAARRNDGRAIEMFKRAAERGHPGAQFQLGRIYEKGFGTAKNLAEAFRWFRQAADQGNPDAQAGLGTLYMKGQGTSRNDNLALEWLNKAAAGGNDAAMFNLGVLHQEGRAGLRKSRAEAEAWYRKSAALGNAEAKKALNR